MRTLEQKLKSAAPLKTAFWIYFLAFILMTWSFRAQSADVKKEVKKPTVVMITNKGKIVLTLDNEKAPISTENFLKYVDQKFYDGVIFHRVMSDFMIQGGGYTPNLKEKKTLGEIKNEAKNGLSNKRGTIAMARTNVVDSASSQFFINTVDNGFRLDHKSDQDYGYAVFGEVTEGMDVVDKIRAVKTEARGEHANVPVDVVLIKTARRGK